MESVATAPAGDAPRRPFEAVDQGGGTGRAGPRRKGGVSGAGGWGGPVRALSILLLLPVAGLLVAFQGLAGRGIDFTDEGHYLNSIATPHDYPVDLPASLFGYIFHPLYLIVGGDVALLRLANLALAYGLAGALAAVVLGACFARVAGDRIVLLALAAGLATLAFAPAYWLPLTPSYNWLALDGLILASIGLVLADRRPTPASIAGWLIIGFGGWLTFMAKSSTGAALAVAALVYLVSSGRAATRLLVLPVALATGLVIASALVISGSPIGLGQRLAADVAFQGLLGSGQELGKIVRLDSLELTRLDQAVAVALVAWAGLAMAGAARGPSWVKWAFALGAIGLAVLAVVLQVLRPGLPAYTGEGLIVCLAPTLALALRPVAARQGASRRRIGPSFAILLFVLPYVYAFGSNGNYWHSGANASLFWVLSGVVGVSLWGRERPALSRLVAPAFLVPVLSTLVLLTGNAQPYRQPPDASRYAVPYDIPGGGRLLLPPGYAQYLSALRATATAAGASPGTGVIDLTGQSPGALFAAGLRSVGAPWLVGGYPGSEPTARAELTLQPCEVLAQAWLLLEPGGPRSLDPALLASFGARIDADYIEAGTVPVPQHAGGYDSRPPQVLLKPVRAPEPSASACRAARGGAPAASPPNQVLLK